MRALTQTLVLILFILNFQHVRGQSWDPPSLLDLGSEVDATLLEDGNLDDPPDPILSCEADLTNISGFSFNDVSSQLDENSLVYFYYRETDESNYDYLGGVNGSTDLDLVLDENTDAYEVTLSSLSFNSGAFPALDAEYIIVIARNMDDDDQKIYYTEDKTLFVRKNPTSNIVLGGNAAMCEGESVSIDANASNQGQGGTATHEWNSADDPGLTYLNPTNSDNSTFTGDVGNYEYSYVVSYDYGNGLTCNSSSESVQFTVNANPTVNPSLVGGINGNNLCEETSGASVNGNASGGTGSYNHQWSVSPSSGLGIPPTNSGTFNLSPVSPDSYTVTYTATDGNSCSAQGTIDIDVNPSPNVNIGGIGGAPICPGQSIMLTASGASTYVWLPGGSGSSINVSPTSQTQYTVTGTDGNGCTDTDMVTVNVRPSVVVNLSFPGGSPHFVCNNETVVSFNYTNVNGSEPNGGNVNIESVLKNSLGEEEANSGVVTISPGSNSASFPIGSLEPGDYTIELTSAQYANPPACEADGILDVISFTILAKPEYTTDFNSGLGLCQLDGQEVNVNLTASSDYLLSADWNIEGAGISGMLNNLSPGPIVIPVNLDGYSGGVDALFNLEIAYDVLSTCSTESSHPFTSKPKPELEFSVPGPNFEDLYCSSYPLENYTVENLSTGSGTISYEVAYSINGGVPVTGGPFQVEDTDQVPINLDNNETGTHTLTITSQFYSDGLVCQWVPPVTDFEFVLNLTPEAILPPSPISFCNYQDSVPTVADLENLFENWTAIKGWVDESGTEYQSTDELDAAVMYYPYDESPQGCRSMLDNSLMADLVAVPTTERADISPSESAAMDGFCSANDIEVIIDDPNATGFCAFAFIPGSNISLDIVDSCYTSTTDFLSDMFNDSDDEGNVDFIIQAIRVLNDSVTCWSDSIAMEFTINPNTRFEPDETDFSVCQNSDVLQLDANWNNIGGNIEWDYGGLPDSEVTEVEDDILEVQFSDYAISPELFEVTISGAFGNCSDNVVFTIDVQPSPEFTDQVMDLDETICHNEYVNLQVLIDGSSEYDVTWSCEGCEFPEKSSGERVMTRWLNPPEGGVDTWSYFVTVEDTLTDNRCATSRELNISDRVLNDLASCPLGVALFEPYGLGVVDRNANYFQWYSWNGSDIQTANPIESEDAQSFFEPNLIDLVSESSCEPIMEQFIVATSLYNDKCWSTTINCFEADIDRECAKMKSNSEAPSFSLYPNPARTGHVIIEELTNVSSGVYQLEVINLSGVLVYGDELFIEGSSTFSLNLGTIGNGVYLVRISNGDISESLKLVIQE